jgi:DNA mismatch repair ATPase MutL
MPKELIQNADDAGATKVCFLYDERENIDWH